MEKIHRDGITREGGRLLLHLHIQPRSSREGITGMHGDRIRFAVHAPAQDGAANQALIKALAKVLGVSRSSLSIVSGKRSREKDILIDCEITEEEVCSRLEFGGAQ